MVSTKGRYALQVMIDLCEHCDEDRFITLKELSQRLSISEKYLESILAILSKNEVVLAVRGKGGGYKLLKDPKDYTIKSILSVTEKSLAPVSCLECRECTTSKEENCKMLPMWKTLDKIIGQYLQQITLYDLTYNKIPTSILL